jgi:hypothetical protein
VIDSRAPHAVQLAKYNLGDQVKITCKSIKPVWEEDTSRYQYLELTKIQLLGKASPDEGSKLVARQDGLEDVRRVNLEYAAKLPNFVADETAKRYSSNGDSSEWRYVDTIETEITFRGSKVVRKQIRRDGKAWEKPFEALPGFKWSGGFGTEIRPLFDPQCPTEIKQEGHAKYWFRSPPDGCFTPFYLEYQRYNPERTGHFFLDEPTGNLIRLEEEASGFPPEMEFTSRKEEVSWDYVKIGDMSHLLPVGAKFVVTYSSGSRWKVEVEFKNHRHFEASANITFQ